MLSRYNHAAGKLNLKKNTRCDMNLCSRKTENLLVTLYDRKSRIPNKILRITVQNTNGLFKV